MIKQYEAQLQQLRKEIDAVNRERKLQQTAVGRELRELEHEYYGSVAKNLQISLACQKLQEEIDRWKDRMDALEQQGQGQQQEGQPGPSGAQDEPAAAEQEEQQQAAQGGAEEQQQAAQGGAEGQQETQDEGASGAPADSHLPNGVGNGGGGGQDGPEPMQEG